MVGSSRTLAENAMHKRKVEIAENRFLDVKKEQRIKFKDFAKEFLATHSKANKKSWKSDEYNIKNLNETFGGKYLYAISTNDIEKYVASRVQKVSPATTNRELATIKTMFNKAIVWGKIEQNPAKTVKFLKEPAGRLRFLEIEEINKLLVNCSKQLRPIVSIAVFTGMRRGEILGLKWHDIDFKNSTITILNTKNGEKREIYINEQVKDVLIRVRKHIKSQYIFCDINGKPFYNIRKSFSTACKKSGINSFRFHDLRHTFASQLVMSGFDINTVRELLGHKDIRMTLRYSHLSQNYKRRALDVLGSRIDTGKTLDDSNEIVKNISLLQPSEVK